MVPRIKTSISAFKWPASFVLAKITPLALCLGCCLWFLPGCSVWQSEGRKFLEREGLEFVARGSQAFDQYQTDNCTAEETFQINPLKQTGAFRIVTDENVWLMNSYGSPDESPGYFQHFIYFLPTSSTPALYCSPLILNSAKATLTPSDFFAWVQNPP